MRIDLKEISDKVKEGLKVVPIAKLEEAVPYVFPKMKTKISPRKRKKKIQSKTELKSIVEKACGYISIGLEQLTKNSSEPSPVKITLISWARTDSDNAKEAVL